MVLADLCDLVFPGEGPFPRQQLVAQIEGSAVNDALTLEEKYGQRRSLTVQR